MRLSKMSEVVEGQCILSKMDVHEFFIIKMEMT